jgi:Zn-dependent peptidase ImmA (M78 family)
MDFPPIPHIAKKAKDFPTIHSLDEALALAESLGVKVDFFDLGEELQGVFVELHSGPRIAVNERLRDCEKVQVLLHELAHVLFHYDHCFLNYRLGAEFDYRREEREADCFAWLLMGEGLREDYLNPPEGTWAE